MTLYFGPMRHLLLTLFIATAASAETIEPVGTSSLQSARGLAFFRNPVGVVVRTDAGKPIQGAVVTFTSPTAATEPALYLDDPVVSVGDVATASTNASGIAMLPRRVIAGLTPGTYQLMASYAGVLRLMPPLRVLPGRVDHLVTLSAGDETARMGRLMAKAYSVRAVDIGGRGVPQAAVTFRAPDGGVTFDGQGQVTVMADAGGVATAPLALVARAGGGNVVIACTAGNSCETYSFKLTDGSRPYVVTLLGRPPESLEVGQPIPEPFVVKVTGLAGKGVPGVPVFFSRAAGWRDPSDFGPVRCAVDDRQPDGDGEDPSVLTDANGIAVSRIYVGTQGPIWCGVGIQVPSSPAIGGYFFTYEADTLEMNAPAAVESIASRPFAIEVAFTAPDREGNGIPIFGQLADVAIVPGSGGASAALIGKPAGSRESDVLTINLRPNGRAGDYQVVVTHGATLRTVIQVNQRAR